MKIKRILMLAAAVAALASCDCGTKVAPSIPQDKEVEAKVEKILKGLTLEEKIGQMTQLNATAVANGVDIPEFAEKAIRE